MGRRARQWKCRCAYCEIGKQHKNKRREPVITRDDGHDIWSGTEYECGLDPEEIKDVINEGPRS